nr:uncharacterized protein CI109_004780 [Kwoniella shandongensis]KAA5526780.1 hypothetical protein CI109_004780 [Kwoniella shandongensis]
MTMQIPDDVLALVIFHIDPNDSSTLLSLARVNRFANHHATRLLYQNVRLDTPRAIVSFIQYTTAANRLLVKQLHLTLTIYHYTNSAFRELQSTLKPGQMELENLAILHLITSGPRFHRQTSPTLKLDSDCTLDILIQLWSAVFCHGIGPKQFIARHLLPRTEKDGSTFGFPIGLCPSLFQAIRSWTELESIDLPYIGPDNMYLPVLPRQPLAVPISNKINHLSVDWYNTDELLDTSLEDWIEAIVKRYVKNNKVNIIDTSNPNAQQSDPDDQKVSKMIITIRGNATTFLDELWPLINQPSEEQRWSHWNYVEIQEVPHDGDVPTQWYDEAANPGDDEDEDDLLGLDDNDDSYSLDDRHFTYDSDDGF